MINLPSRIFATRAEIEAAKSGKDPELARKYIEALEEIAHAALELDEYEYENTNEIDWEPLRNALGKVFCI